MRFWALELRHSTKRHKFRHIRLYIEVAFKQKLCVVTYTGLILLMKKVSAL